MTVRRQKKSKEYETNEGGKPKKKDNQNRPNAESLIFEC